MYNINRNEKMKEIVAYLAVCIFWGSTYLAIRIGVGELPPLFFAGMRYFVAGGLVLIFAYFKGMEFPKTFKETRKIAIVGILLLFVCNGSLVWSLQRVPSSIASILFAITPLLMALLEFVHLGKKINIKGLVGLLLGFGGVVILITSRSSMEQAEISYSMLILFSALMWAVGSIYSKTFEISVTFIINIGIQMFTASIFLLVTSMFIGEFPRVHISTKGIAATLYLIIFGSFIAYSCYIYILKKWTAAKAGTFAYVNPLVAVLLGVIVLYEAITLKEIISIIVILGGVFLVQTSSTTSKIKKKYQTIEKV